MRKNTIDINLTKDMIYEIEATLYKGKCEITPKNIDSYSDLEKLVKCEGGEIINFCFDESLRSIIYTDKVLCNMCAKIICNKTFIFDSISRNEIKSIRFITLKVKNESYYTAPITKFDICDMFSIRDMRFSNNTVVVFWEDNTKTIVTMQEEEDKYDLEKAIMAAYMKKALSFQSGKKKSLNNTLDKWSDRHNEYLKSLDKKKTSKKNNKTKK